MDSSEAREHIEMVDQILARSERSLRVGGEFFLVWGIISAAVILIFQLYGVSAGGRLIVSNAAAISAGKSPSLLLLWVFPLLIGAGVIFSVVRGRALKRDCERQSMLQREFLNLLTISLGMAAVVNVGAFWIFPGLAQGAIWSVACSIVLIYIASHGNRLALVCAVILVGSLIVANFSGAFAGYALAAGMLVGYAGFGLASLIARD